MEKISVIWCCVVMLLSLGVVSGLVIGAPEESETGKPERGRRMSEGVNTSNAESKGELDSVVMYVGTYTPKGEGIYIFSLDLKTGNIVKIDILFLHQL